MVLDLTTLEAPSRTDEVLLGAVPEQPFIIVGILTSRALGDFIVNNVVAASIKKLFKHSKLYFYCQNDRYYKKSILKMNPYVDRVFYMEKNAHLAMDNFGHFTDIQAMGEHVPNYVTRLESWHRLKCNAPNLIISPSTMIEGTLGSFESPARLAVPENRVNDLATRLAAKGVDPDRWFSVIHYRESTYKLRPARHNRDVSHKPFMELSDRIIKELGGQVVRVGHPGMAPFPARQGFVDLSAEEEAAFDLQAFAISRARFMVGVSTGPLQLASALGTPVANTNLSMPGNIPGCWNDHDLCLHLNLYLSDGSRVSSADATKYGLFDRRRLAKLEGDKQVFVLQNSADELFRIAEMLHDRSEETQGWRIPVQEPFPDREIPNQFTYPLRQNKSVPIVEFPDLAREAYAARPKG